MAGKRIKNKCLVIIPILCWLVQGTRGWGVAKPAQEAAAALAGSPLDPGCRHTGNTITHSVFQLLFPLGSIYVGISMPLPSVRAVVAICSCVGGVPVTEDATRMLGSGTSSLTGAAGTKPMSHDTSACVTPGLGASPSCFNPLSLHKWKLTFLKNFGISSARSRRCQEIIQSPFR